MSAAHRRSILRSLLPLGAAVALGLGQRAAAAPAAEDFYDADTVRALRLDFADADWESRLPTLPEGQQLLADLGFQGRTYQDVGVSQKGNSSSRAPGRKKPLNLTIDATVQGQRLMAYDVVNLNNGFADPSFVRETLVSAQLRPYFSGYPLRTRLALGYFMADTAYVRRALTPARSSALVRAAASGRPCAGSARTWPAIGRPTSSRPRRRATRPTGCSGTSSGCWTRRWRRAG